MCLSCGCGEPHEDHGDPRNFTYEGLRRAAEAAGVSPEVAADNIKAGLANLDTTGDAPGPTGGA